MHTARIVLPLFVFLLTGCANNDEMRARDYAADLCDELKATTHEIAVARCKDHNHYPVPKALHSTITCVADASLDGLTKMEIYIERPGTLLHAPYARRHCIVYKATE